MIVPILKKTETKGSYTKVADVMTKSSSVWFSLPLDPK